MSLKIRFRFDGKCRGHPRYNPMRDGRPQHGNGEGCESLYVIHLYIKIVKRSAEEGKGIVVRTPLTPRISFRSKNQCDFPGHPWLLQIDSQPWIYERQKFQSARRFPL